MNKVTTTMAVLAAAGVAAAAAYGCMKPTAKQQLKRDMKNTIHDMGGVKSEMCNVGQDVTEMARNLKNQM